MFETLQNLPPRTKGILYMVLGGILLLHTFGAFQQLFAFLIGVIGVVLLAYGFMMIDGPRMVKKFIARFTGNKH